MFSEMLLLPEFFSELQQAAPRPARDGDRRHVDLIRALWSATLTKFLKCELEMKDCAGVSVRRCAATSAAPLELAMFGCKRYGRFLVMLTRGPQAKAGQIAHAVASPSPASSYKSWRLASTNTRSGLVLVVLQMGRELRL